MTLVTGTHGRWFAEHSEPIDWYTKRQDAIPQVVAGFQHFLTLHGGPLTPALHAFCAAWSGVSGKLEVRVDQALRDAFPCITPVMLRSWHATEMSKGMPLDAWSGDHREASPAYATARELSGMPGMPRGLNRTRLSLNELGVPSRLRQGRGGGVEYRVDALPARTKQAWIDANVATRPDKPRFKLHLDGRLSLLRQGRNA